MSYKPTLPPAGDGRNSELIAYLYTELLSAANVINQGEFITIRLDVLENEPPRPKDGDIAHFADNVVNPQGGLYSRENGVWHKL